MKDQLVSHNFCAVRRASQMFALKADRAHGPLLHPQQPASHVNTASLRQRCLESFLHLPFRKQIRLIHQQPLLAHVHAYTRQ